VVSNVPGADQSPAPRIFAESDLYTVAEIAERLKCGTDTVDRKMKAHKVKCIRFGAKKYLGRDLNRVLEAEWQGG
jgi:excisionase family DNA binding protein